MLKEQTITATYFLAGTDFASAKIDDIPTEVISDPDGTPITEHLYQGYFEFDVYANLLKALVDGYDTIRLKVVSDSKLFKFAYLKGNSAAMVEYSRVNFATNVKNEIQGFLPDEISETVELEIINLLSDDIVTKVGNGTINEDNFVDYLPIIEQELIERKQLSRSQSTTDSSSSTLSGNFVMSTKKIFQNSSIHPAEVGLIDFPSKKVQVNDDGVTQGSSAISTNLLKNLVFYDYYHKFFYKSTNSLIPAKKIQTAKANYEKINVVIPLIKRIEQVTPVAELKLSVSLVKDGIEFSRQLFGFGNKQLWTHLTAGGSNIEAGIKSFEDVYALPDVLTITNNESYPVSCRPYECVMSYGEFNVTPLNPILLEPGMTSEINATNIFFSNTEPRVYAIKTARSIPGSQQIYNVSTFVRPPQAQPSKPSSNELNLVAKPTSTASSVIVELVGLLNNDYTAEVFRKRIGGGNAKLIARLTAQSNSFTDTSLDENEIYVYVANVFHNDSGHTAKATTGYLSYVRGYFNRLSFSITNKNENFTSGQGTHEFQIKESIATTAASELLKTVGESGQAGMFEGELDSTKQDTTMITSYSIARENHKSGQVEFLGHFKSNEKLSFNVYQSGKYTYYISPAATSTSALSYKTIISEADIATGKEYKLSYKKWRDDNFLRQEILPSWSEVVRNDITQALLDIPSGIPQTISFENPIRPGSVSALSGTANKKLQKVFLNWRYSGSWSEILHFVVLANYNGIKAPIGALIPDPTLIGRALYTYCDDVLGHALGDRTYTVLPVLKNGTKGIESKSLIVRVEDTYLQSALRDGVTFR